MLTITASKDGYGTFVGSIRRPSTGRGAVVEGRHQQRWRPVSTHRLQYTVRSDITVDPVVLQKS